MFHLYFSYCCSQAVCCELQYNNDDIPTIIMIRISLKPIPSLSNANSQHLHVPAMSMRLRVSSVRYVDFTANQAPASAQGFLTYCLGTPLRHLRFISIWSKCVGRIVPAAVIPAAVADRGACDGDICRARAWSGCQSRCGDISRRRLPSSIAD